MTDRHEAEPSADPAAATAATATADGTGAPAPGQPRGRLTGSAVIHAVTEGHSAVITILAVFVALVIGAVLIVASDPVVLRAWASLSYAPGTALSATWTSVSAAYSALFEGSIVSPSTISAAFHGGSIAAIFYPLSLTAFEATPLILTGLSVAVAFRAGMFNIGAAGQWIGGAVIGWIVGVVKARTGAHEVILTIMLNYIMYNLLSFLLGTPTALQQPGQSNLISPPIAANAALPHVGGPPTCGSVALPLMSGATALLWPGACISDWLDSTKARKLYMT